MRVLLDLSKYTQGLKCLRYVHEERDIGYLISRIAFAEFVTRVGLLLVECILIFRILA